MLTLIIAEAALETVPKEIWFHPSVVKQARLKGKKAGEILLDRSLHHAAMKQLKDASKRGRPDLVHFSLLEAVSAPLYMNRGLSLYLHTIADNIIDVGYDVRLPKSYFRFEGLIEKLFKTGKIESGGEMLLELKKGSVKDILNILKPSKVIGLSIIGERSSFEKVAKELAYETRPALIIGGFPRGHFSQKQCSNFDAIYSIHSMHLETHVVVARIIYEYEKQISYHLSKRESDLSIHPFFSSKLYKRYYRSSNTFS